MGSWKGFQCLVVSCLMRMESSAVLGEDNLSMADESHSMDNRPNLLLLESYGHFFILWTSQTAIKRKTKE